MEKNKKLFIMFITLCLIISLLLIIFDNDKNLQSLSYDKNYSENDNSIYFYQFNNTIYYIDNDIPSSVIDNGTYKYCKEVDPRSYTDFRDYYLFKNSLLVSGEYITKYKCMTDECYIISRDGSSIINMTKLFKNGSVIIYDGIERNIIVE